MADEARSELRESPLYFLIVFSPPKANFSDLTNLLEVTADTVVALSLLGNTASSWLLDSEGRIFLFL